MKPSWLLWLVEVWWKAKNMGFHIQSEENPTWILWLVSLFHLESPPLSPKSCSMHSQKPKYTKLCLTIMFLFLLSNSQHNIIYHKTPKMFHRRFFNNIHPKMHYYFVLWLTEITLPSIRVNTSIILHRLEKKEYPVLLMAFKTTSLLTDLSLDNSKKLKGQLLLFL